MVETKVPHYPKKVPNFMGGKMVGPRRRHYFDKINPHNGKVICQVARSTQDDIDAAVKIAQAAQPIWAALPAVKRGEVLFQITELMRENRTKIASIINLETGKSQKEALGEIDGAIALARFYAGEGQRMYGRTTTSALANKFASTVREPVGVAGLIIAANTPIANIAWKVFPALICGNSAILKCSEDAPLTAWIFAHLCAQSELTKGTLAVIHGIGEEAGAALVSHPGVNLISFTGSTAVGRLIAKVAGERLAKVSLELGGKNPLIVCDDADFENALKWTLLSAFSNAGQRCAACSRVIIFDSIYPHFKQLLLQAVTQLKVGPTNGDDFGPVINAKQLTNILKAIQEAVKRGAKILSGGYQLTDQEHRDGYYIAPTVIEDVSQDDPITKEELFGPVTCLYRAKDFNHALKLANDSPYGLTAAIHTRDVNRAREFTRRIEAGVAVVNGGTYGSEPHMPFGGVKQSGNGTREPGSEALEIYSNIKDIYELIEITKGD